MSIFRKGNREDPGNFKPDSLGAQQDHGGDASGNSVRTYRK